MIETRNLKKHYDGTDVLRGVDLSVPPGAVCGLLGPNGAGKTTAVRILTTLTRADGGCARVAGFDVATQPMDVRRRIGLASQDATVDALLSGRQNLVMVAELHSLTRREARRRAGDLLERFSLADAGDRLVRDYSGGMRRRLDLAATLVHAPPVLFLDEPTTGLDPRARNELWAALDTLVDTGTTVLLTTQYLEEADRLADDVVVIDRGSVIAQGDPRTLKRDVSGDQLVIVPFDHADLAAAAAILERATGAVAAVDVGARSAAAPTHAGVTALGAAAAELARTGIRVDDLGLRQPTLDDVFLTLTDAAAAGVPSDEIPAEEALR